METTFAQTEPLPVPIAPEETNPKLLPPIEDSETDPEQIPPAIIPDEEIIQNPPVPNNDTRQDYSWIFFLVATIGIIVIFIFAQFYRKQKISR